MGWRGRLTHSPLSSPLLLIHLILTKTSQVVRVYSQAYKAVKTCSKIMTKFNFAYNRLREAYMAFTHSHSYHSFQAWYNECHYIDWVWGYYGGIFERADYYSSPQKERAQREWESFLLRTAKIFDILADCTDWHESVPYFYENGDPEATLRQFFPELEEADRIRRENSLGKDYFPF